MALDKSFAEIPRELEFVLNCVKCSPTEKESICILLSPDMDWDYVLRLSMAHSIFPLVYNTLNSLDTLIIPEYVINSLRQSSIMNAIKVVGMSNEIVRIINNMNEYGIQVLILKGSPLSVKINEDIAYRPSNDIDILVDPLEFASAEKILVQMGYIRVYPDFLLTPRQQEAFFTRCNHFEYFHLKRNIHVELHWRIRFYNVKYFPPLSKLKTQKMNLSGCLVSVMDNEYWLIFLMVHGHKHMWSRLRWLYDIKEFMKMNIDWDKLIIQADISGLRPIINQTLILANELLDVPIPQCMVQSVANDQKAWQLAFTAIDKLFININELSLPGPKFLALKKNIFDDLDYYNLPWKSKLFLIFSLFKPCEVEFKLISLPDNLYPLYYFIRPLYLLWRGIVRG